jgi:hypothetical protein
MLIANTARPTVNQDKNGVHYVLSETTASSSGAHWLVKALTCFLVLRGFPPQKTSHRFQRWYLTAHVGLFRIGYFAITDYTAQWTKLQKYSC